MINREYIYNFKIVEEVKTKGKFFEKVFECNSDDILDLEDDKILLYYILGKISVFMNTNNIDINEISGFYKYTYRYNEETDTYEEFNKEILNIEYIKETYQK